ncbi:MAG TPA: TAXI family TRAP transporter solute-binding subunit [Bacillales bacterium]|nr:TAXI family TRAP transporter solute-binding subunit [Bacillales bacterium]
MKRYFGLLALIFVLVAALFGCGGGGSSSTGTSSSSSGDSSSGQSSDSGGGSGSSSGKTLDITFSTATTTGVYYPLGAALSKMWNDKVQGVKVSSQASDGSVQNLHLMQQGKINMALTTVGVLYNAYNGKAKFKGNPFKDVRIIAALYPNVGQIVARKGSGIHSIADIKGKKFVPGAPGSSTRVLSNHILAAYGLTFKDTKAQFVGFTQAAQLMRNKQIDVTDVMAGLPTSAVVEMLSTANGEIVPIDEQHIKKMQSKYPWLFGYDIPAGTYDGQDKAVHTVAQANMLIVPKDMPEDIVYNLTKAMWDKANITTIRNSVAAAKNMKLENATTGLAGVPLADGAKKFYKEKGVLK